MKDNDLILGFTIINGADLTAGPSLDSIYHNIGNTDLFRVYYFGADNEQSVAKLKELITTLASDQPIELKVLSGSDRKEIFQKTISLIKNEGYEYALYCPAGEFLPPNIKSILLKQIEKDRVLAFPVKHITKNLQANKAGAKIRLLRLADHSELNLLDTVADDTDLSTEAVHDLSRIFTGSTSEGTAFERDFPLYAREQIAARFAHQSQHYPLAQALQEIVEDHGRAKTNTVPLTPLYTNSRGYRESMATSITWTESYGVTEALVKRYGVTVMAEVGVARGHHSAHLLEAVPDLTVYSVDPWGLFFDEHKSMWKKIPEDIEPIYQAVVSLLKPFSDRSRIIRSTSERGIIEVPDDLDMVFIDADHTYESVKKDIGLWWDKVKTGGIISGHDCDHPNHPGVTKAVYEYFGHTGIPVQRNVGNVWWVEKPAEFLSYIIPSYNAEGFLAETVASIFTQNLSIPFEIIISDDNSKDGTPALIERLATEHKEIRPFLNKENRGAPGNRNFAISQSKGNLIYMLDHDNVLAPDTMQKLVDAIRQRGVGAASCGELSFFKGEITNHRGSWIYRYPNDLFTLQEYISHTDSPAASNNLMFTRAAFDKTGGYPERGARENLGFGLRLVATGTAIAIVPGTKYFHRILASGMWLDEAKKDPSAAHRNMTLIFREFLDLFDDRSRQLLESARAEIEADGYIAKKKLSLSEKGWTVAGGRRKSVSFSFYHAKANIQQIMKILMRRTLSVLRRSSLIKSAFFHYRLLRNHPGIMTKLVLLKRFRHDLRAYEDMNDNQNFIWSRTNQKPCLHDRTTLTPVDHTYFYQNTWCAKKIFERRPAHHYDIGSSVELVGLLSQFTPTTMVDIRPVDVALPGLDFTKGDLLALPFEDGSLPSVSCICVIEHIGLGRYGDRLDPHGSEKAVEELKRVLSSRGDLYVSVPVDTTSKVMFNAHRTFTREHVLRLFAPLDLVEERYIYKSGLVKGYDETRGFGTGLFHFTKKT